MRGTTSTKTIANRKFYRSGTLDARIAKPETQTETQENSKVTLTLPPKVEYQPTPFDKFKEWFGKRFGSKKARNATAKRIIVKIDSAARHTGRILRFNVTLALIAMLVVEFCPHLLDTCPVFFQFCEGILAVYEFVIRATFTALNALLHIFFLQLDDGFASICSIFSELEKLISQFLNWIPTITF